MDSDLHGWHEDSMHVKEKSGRFFGHASSRKKHQTNLAAIEEQYVGLLEELPSLTLEGIRRRPAQARATASGLQSQLLELANGSCARPSLSRSRRRRWRWPRPPSSR